MLNAITWAHNNTIVQQNSNSQAKVEKDWQF